MPASLAKVRYAASHRLSWCPSGSDAEVNLTSHGSRPSPAWALAPPSPVVGRKTNAFGRAPPELPVAASDGETSVSSVLEQRSRSFAQFSQFDLVQRLWTDGRRGRELQCAQATISDVGEPVHRRQLAREYAVLSVDPIHDKPAPAIRQRIREHAVKTVVRVVRGLLEGDVEGEGERRQARGRLQVLPVVLEEHALPVLR